MAVFTAIAPNYYLQLPDIYSEAVGIIVLLLLAIVFVVMLQSVSPTVIFSHRLAVLKYVVGRRIMARERRGVLFSRVEFYAESLRILRTPNPSVAIAGPTGGTQELREMIRPIA